MRFLILSRYRSGSTLLAKSLAAHPEVRVGEEAFNVGNLARHTRLLDDPAGLLRSIFEPDGQGACRAAGFKLMYGQATRAELVAGHWHPGPNPKLRRAIETIEARIRSDRERYLANLESTWTRLSRDAGLRVVHLVRRDRLALYLSFVLAMTDDLWSYSPYRTRRVWLDPERCRSFFEAGEEQRRRSEDLFASQPRLELDYESLAARPSERIRDVLEFLGVEPRSLPPATPRQQQRPLHEVIENYEELRRYFEGTAWGDSSTASAGTCPGCGAEASG
jgi:LPS sulfotransferase NodH